MLHTIRVKTTISPDLLGNAVYSDAKHIAKNLKAVETAKVYRLEGISERQAKLLAEKLFCESINQTFTINEPILYSSSEEQRDESRSSRLRSNNISVIEIGYKPGVMNPEAGSIMQAAKDLDINLIAADSSHEYCFLGTLKNVDVQTLAEKLKLFNPLVEHIITRPPQTLQIKGVVGPTRTIPIRRMTNTTLIHLAKDTLFLNLEEMQAVQKYFQKIKRDPTDCELETLAQTWSEHCAHKTFKAKLVVNGKKKQPLFTRLKKEALKHNKHIVSAFVDNSGVMDFYDGWALCGKAETHNSPSAIEPYGGAMTGSGGVFRDVVGTGQGAKAISSTDIFCLATPHMEKQKLPDGCLPPDYMLKRVVTAVKDYGNRIGIPTNNGSFHFHDDFRAKPTVLVGAYGMLPKKRAQKGKPKTGDLIIVIGGRTGRDGIHGATFSSGEMTNRTSLVNATAVQIGNAIEEKRVFDALLEARDANCIRAVQDLGAGGFSSAIGEIGEKTGVTVDLAKAKLKYEGLSPWEIWVSESQERMCVAAPKAKLQAFLEICEKYNVESAVLGTFDGRKKLQVYYGKQKIADLSMDFLHHGLPQRTMIAKQNTDYSSSGVKRSREVSSRQDGYQTVTRQARTIKSPQSQKDWLDIIEKVLSHPTISSKEPICRLYDHSVQGTSIVAPYSGERMDGPNDAAVVRPLLDKPYGMVLSHGLNPVLNNIDPYWGSIWASIEALSNYVAVGGDYRMATLINNYVWPFPDEASLFTLDQSVDAVIDVMKTFKIPVISGKDSLSSTYRSKDGNVLKIPPVLCLSVFGKIPDVRKTQTADFKKNGSVIVLMGKQDANAMGGSIYFETTFPSPASSPLGRGHEVRVPKPDLKHLPTLFQTITQGIQSGKILACHDISEGGLITALFEMCVGGDCGATINVNTSDSGRQSVRRHDSSEVKAEMERRPDLFLFNETAGTFLVEVTDEKLAKAIFKTVPHMIIGKTQKEKRINVSSGKKKLFTADLDSLKQAWQEPMKEYF